MGPALTVVVTILGVLTSSACATSGSPAADLVAETSSRPATSAASSAASAAASAQPSNRTPAPPAASKSAAAADPGPGAFGTSHTWDDGLQVATSAVKKFTPDETAFGFAAGEQGVRLTVTVINGTKQTFDTSRTSMTLTFGADGAEAEPVIDLPNGVRGGSGLPKKIAPGARATTTFGFSVQPEWLGGLYGRITVGDTKHKPAIFLGSAT